MGGSWRGLQTHGPHHTSARMTVAAPSNPRMSSGHQKRNLSEECAGCQNGRRPYVTGHFEGSCLQGFGDRQRSLERARQWQKSDCKATFPHLNLGVIGLMGHCCGSVSVLGS